MNPPASRTPKIGSAARSKINSRANDATIRPILYLMGIKFNGMKKLVILLVVAVFGAASSACTETEKQSNLLTDGIYSGTFTVEYDSGQSYSNPVSITISGGNYSCSNGENHIPAGGQGTFSISGSKITFQDTLLWTADFDWNLILNGEYTIAFDGDEIEISALKNGLGLYQYKLRKEE